MKPAFIGIGAQKCASTWLHRILATHPQIFLPEPKEVDFFSYRFDHGYQWYERQFAGRSAAQCCGEISPSYLHDLRAPERVSRYAPEMKLLVALRDPVERALSNHRHEVRLGHICGEDLSLEAGLANNPMYIEQGLYARHLDRWLDWFAPSQVCVVFMEEIQADPQAVVRRVFRFLDVDDAFEPPGLDSRFNASFVNRSKGLERLKDSFYRLAMVRGMGWMWGASVRVGARELYRRLNVADSDDLIPPACPKTLLELRRHFAQDVRELERLLDRDLSHWCADVPQPRESSRPAERVRWL